MKRITSVLQIYVAVVTGVSSLEAQFNSGSNGTDLALNLTTPGEVIFDPKDTATFGRVLDADGDYIYHFTTINIAQGVTLKFSGRVLRAPVIWLAQGAVTINGKLDLKGADGHPEVLPSVADRILAVPGAGGYAGGVGAWGSSPPQSGGGPEGGDFIFDPRFPEGCPERGGVTVNEFLVPLTGGSGAAGAGGGGGAGGGALLIASTTSITINGQIDARGGTGGQGRLVARSGGSGAGGAVRLVASTISGTGWIDVTGGPRTGCFLNNEGATGRIRLEAFNFTAGGLNGTRSTPFGLFLPMTPPPSILVTSVGGRPVPPNPTGSFVVPDVTIDTPAAVSVDIEGQNISTGTSVTLYIY